MNDDATTTVNLERLFKLRLVVARHGEMDCARWWNTKGLLGRLGQMAISRGFPRTHNFAQARAVFAVARSRCQELFDPPGCMTLWHLPAEVEDQFEDRWHDWLDEAESWSEFFEKLQSVDGSDLLASLQDFDLLDSSHLEDVRKLRRSAEGRAVPLPGMHELHDDVIALLAAGFSRGEPGAPAVPYSRLQGDS